jgi:hypothetical protein
MFRAVLDNDAWNRLIDTPGARDAVRAAVDAGRVELLCTHINIDEASAAADPRRGELLAAITSLAQNVPTGAFVLDTSKWSEARLSSDEDAALINSLRSAGDPHQRRPDQPLGNVRHTNDELHAATARFEGCALVTDDGRLRRRRGERRVEILSFEEFLEKIGFRRGG